MAPAETAVSPEQNAQVTTNNLWSLAGLILACLVNAAWIGFLGYCVVSLII
jgi:Trk-type K+ transport system membrane component